jgi:hypothetical protein
MNADDADDGRGWLRVAHGARKRHEPGRYSWLPPLGTLLADEASLHAQFFLTYRSLRSLIQIDTTMYNPIAPAIQNPAVPNDLR